MIPDYPKQDLSVQMRELWKTSFGDDDVFLDHFFSTGFSQDRCRCIVNEEGKLLSILYWFDVEFEGQKYAYLYAVATDPGHRGQGLLRYLLADTHQLLADLHYAGALLVPGDEGLRKMYASRGYTDCTSYSSIISASQPVSIPIHQIDEQEYGKLRRTYLPRNAVIQEGACLRFLSTQYTFYTGPGFVLCARPKNKEVLESPEFLGSPEMLPAVLCALGYPMGSFRIPGDALPFAMLCPFRKGTPIPSYFGLAFD